MKNICSPEEVPEELLVDEPGDDPVKVVSYSYFNTPILLDAEIYRGNSRRWGDVPKPFQKVIVRKLVEAARQHRFSWTETCLLLALVRHESGFNPDAAAGSTSAHGLGQFVNRTGEFYGLNDENRWTLEAQIRAVIDHTCDNLEQARRRLVTDSKENEALALAYALHHDGPSLKYGGLRIAREYVMPYQKKFFEWLG